MKVSLSITLPGGGQVNVTGDVGELDVTRFGDMLPNVVPSHPRYTVEVARWGHLMTMLRALAPNITEEAWKVAFRQRTSDLGAVLTADVLKP